MQTRVQRQRKNTSVAKAATTVTPQPIPPLLRKRKSARTTTGKINQVLATTTVISSTPVLLTSSLPRAPLSFDLLMATIANPRLLPSSSTLMCTIPDTDISATSTTIDYSMSSDDDFFAELNRLYDNNTATPATITQAQKPKSQQDVLFAALDNLLYDSSTAATQKKPLSTSREKFQEILRLGMLAQVMFFSDDKTAESTDIKVKIPLSP